MASRNCPNCGAPIKGNACAYCGTVFEQPEKVLPLAVGRKASVSFEHEGRLYEFDMVLEQVQMSMEVTPGLYSDGIWCRTAHGLAEYEADLRCRLVKNEKHGGEGYVFVRDLAPCEITC